MRIGIACYPTYGGSGALATELGIELAARGHEIHFITYAQPFRLTSFHEGLFFHEVEVPHYPLFEYPPYSLALTVRMHEVARQHDLEIMHAHYAIPHAEAAWVAGQMLRKEGRNLKVVTTLHGTDITLVGQDPSFWSITRFSVEQSDGVTAVSEYLRQETHQAFQCDKLDIRVVPNFVDPEIYKPGRDDCHLRALAPHGEKIVMHISNFRKVKRVDDVVRIFAGIRQEVESRLVFVGDGPERASVTELASRLGVLEDIVFLGKLESVAGLLSCADLFLLPSEQESFGLVALEALASGVPVVGTGGSGLAEVVDHGVTGYLHPVGAVEAMAASSVQLLTDADLWSSFGRAARDAAVRRYSAALIVPMYERFYQEVLEGSSR
ncbi:MAG: N-acetyl-alpha-D-glucosaminyl L-malate synthase BshA [Gemmatimonadetes bacterium]|nr:N-acetyl-alpha-D-glucosaminyl L-malate synthase BshA [Gemmatimonadota bacterium]NNK47276.1 N-acetyl-alpha-D-glucosaminyl L-malate synthase BshA [Gemmatimonadota bacterium]